MMRVSLCLFSEGMLQNREQCLSGCESGLTVHVVERLCPGMHEGTGRDSIYITSGRTEGHTQQSETGTVQLAG